MVGGSSFGRRFWWVGMESNKFVVWIVVLLLVLSVSILRFSVGWLVIGGGKFEFTILRTGLFIFKFFCYITISSSPELTSFIE